MTVFAVTNTIGENGETVTMHVYINGDHVDYRHPFTMQSPYKMNYELAGGENRTLSFKKGTVGGFTYYCIYDQPIWLGHLVLP